MVGELMVVRVVRAVMGIVVLQWAASAVWMVDRGGGRVMVSVGGQGRGRGVHRVGRRGSTSPAGRAAVMVQRHAMGRRVLFRRMSGRRVPPAAASEMRRIAVGEMRRRGSAVRVVVVVIVVRIFL